MSSLFDMNFKSISLAIVFWFQAILSGILTFYYNFKNRRIQQSYYLRIYSIVHNMLVLSLTPFFLYVGRINASYWALIPLVEYFMFATVIALVLLVTYIIIFRWRLERQLIDIMLQFRQLEIKYFDRWLQSKQYQGMRHLDMLLYGKLLIMLYLTGLHYLNAGVLFSFGELKLILSGIYVMCLSNITHGVMLQYFICMWHICTRHHIQNTRLQQLVQRFEQFGRNDAVIADLSELLKVHNKLALLVFDVNKIFQYQSFATFFVYCMNNVLTGYCVVLFVMSKVQDFNVVFTLHSSTFYIGVLLDMYCFGCVCEHILKACEETSMLMQELMVLSTYDGSLQRICEQFSLSVSCNKVCINILGLFHVNRSLWFSTMSSTLLYTVFIVQSDYLNVDKFKYSYI